MIRNVWIVFLALLSLGPFLLLSSSSTTPTQQDLIPAVTTEDRPFYETYWQDSTIVITIAMGNATKTHLAERLVASLRSNGAWAWSGQRRRRRQGRIAILTDQPERYAGRWEDVIVLEAKQSDLYPTQKKNRNTMMKQRDSKHPPLEFKREAMRYKRFKTLLLDYLDDYFYQQGQDARPYHYVVYMDIDVVAARPLTTLLQDFQDQMIRKGVFSSVHDTDARNTEESAKNANSTLSSTTKEVSSSLSLPFMAMFSDCPTCARHNTNSGVIVLHRNRSRACLQEWNHLFLEHADWGVYDQRYLRDIRANGQCNIYVLEDHHRLYPTWKDMRLFLSATIVHNTNSYNAKKIPPHVQAKYFAHLVPDYYYTPNGKTTSAADRAAPEVELF